MLKTERAGVSYPHQIRAVCTSNARIPDAVAHALARQERGDLTEVLGVLEVLLPEELPLGLRPHVAELEFFVFGLHVHTPS